MFPIGLTIVCTRHSTTIFLRPLCFFFEAAIANMLPVRYCFYLKPIAFSVSYVTMNFDTYLLNDDKHQYYSVSNEKHPSFIHTEKSKLLFSIKTSIFLYDKRGNIRRSNKWIEVVIVGLNTYYFLRKKLSKNYFLQKMELYMYRMRVHAQ